MATSGDGAGNTGTARRPEAYNWFLTLNNHSELETDELVKMATKYCKKFMIQEEVGEEGTPHLQGSLHLLKKTRMSALSKWNKRIHWEITKNSAAADEYCAKMETSTGKRWSKGFPREVKILPEGALRAWQLDVVQLLRGSPDDRKIYWYYGDTGIGKTTFCKYLSVKFGAIPLSGRSSDMRNGVIEYKKTNGDTPEIIIIPIPKTFNYEYLSYEGIEVIKDMYFYSGKYEGGVVVGNCPHVIVFANEPPEVEKLAADRWVVRKIPSVPLLFTTGRAPSPGGSPPALLREKSSDIQ